MPRNVVVLLNSDEGRRLVRSKCRAAGIKLPTFERLVEAELDRQGMMRGSVLSCATPPLPVMFNIGFGELAVICIVLIIAVGPERLPSMMKTLGKTTLTLELAEPMAALPADIDIPGIEIGDAGHRLTYIADGREGSTTAAQVIRQLDRAGIEFKNIETKRSSLEYIFVDLVSERA